MSDNDELKAIRSDISEMAKSVHELAIALTGYCARQDGFNNTIVDMKEDIKDLKMASNKKFEKLDDRLRDVEKACGVGGVLDEINKHKLKNMLPWFVTCVILVITLINNLR